MEGIQLCNYSAEPEKDLDSDSAGLRRYDKSGKACQISHSGESRNPVLENDHAPYVLNSYSIVFETDSDSDPDRY
ncbi:hypothetical protein JCM31598_15110 [Desulfonatronum parangueonense]